MNKEERWISLNLDYFQGEPLTKDLNKRFKWFIRLKKNRNELLKSAERINWNAIGKFCLRQIDILIKATRIPETMDGNDFIWYRKSYSKTILQLLEYELFHTLCCSINKIDDKTTEPQKDKIINRAITDSKSLIKGTIEILEYQAEASAINWIKKTKGMKSLIKNYAKYTYRGKQLYGKQFLKVEVLAFKKIEQLYIKGQKEGLKHSYRSIAFFVARTELGIDKEADQILFYKRFLRYHKKKK